MAVNCVAQNKERTYPITNEGQWMKKANKKVMKKKSGRALFFWRGGNNTRKGALEEKLYIAI